MWQSPPFPNYGEPFNYFFYGLEWNEEFVSARGKTALIPQVRHNDVFAYIEADGIYLNYQTSFYIGENLKSLTAQYLSLYDGELLYVLGLEVNGVKHYFNASFLFATEGSVPFYSVAGLEENNIAYRSFSLYGQVVEQFIVVPDSSFVLSLNIDTALGVRYKFGEEEIYKLGNYNLIVKKPIDYTFIPSLPKVKLPIKDELKLILN